METEPGALPPRSEHRWAFQPCWHGQRVMVHVHGALTGLGIFPEVRVVDPLGYDLTDLFPELDSITTAAPPVPAVFDGVIVGRAGGGRSVLDATAGLLARLVADRAAGESLRSTLPVDLLVLDIVHLDGRRVGDLPYHLRRALLLDTLQDGPSWHVPPHFPEADRSLREASWAAGADEVVAKRLDSHYFPGMRSPVWLRVPLLPR